MANAAVIARPGRIVGESSTITMHAVMEETHSLSNTVTDHPVEQGFNVTDHSRPNPDEVSFKCIISNTPITDEQATQTIQSGAYTFDTTVPFSSGPIGATDGFAQGEWAKLKTLREAGAIVKVVTTIGDYDSMAITSISLPRNAKYYDAIYFTITFKRIRIVQNKLTRNVKASDTRVGDKKSTGHRTTKDTTQQDVDPLRKVKDTVVGVGNKVLSGFGSTP